MFFLLNCIAFVTVLNLGCQTGTPCSGTHSSHYKSLSGASRVAQKAPLVILGAQVQVKLMRPSIHLTDVQGPFEDDTFLLSGVCLRCTGYDVKKFFSIDSDSEVQQVIFTQQPGVVMLRFAYPPPGK